MGFHASKDNSRFVASFQLFQELGVPAAIKGEFFNGTILWQCLPQLTYCLAQSFRVLLGDKHWYFYEFAKFDEMQTIPNDCIPVAHDPCELLLNINEDKHAMTALKVELIH
jgi:hypothetical protein